MQTIFPNRGSAAHESQEEEQQTRHFQPEYVHNASHVAGSDTPSFIESSDPAVLSRSCARDPQDSAALAAESAVRCGFLFIHG